MSNFEIKSFDGCANPHLGLAAILAAGIDGLRRHLTLPEPIGMTTFSSHEARYFTVRFLNSFINMLVTNFSLRQHAIYYTFPLFPFLILL